MNKDILIINQQHTTNIGDKLIGETMKELFGQYRIDFAPYIPTEVEEDMEHFSIKKRKGKKIIDKLKLNTVINDICFSFKIRKILRRKTYKVAIIGGGELLSGNLEFNSSFCVWTRILEKKKIPIVVAGISGNVVSSRLGKRYKKGLEKCKLIYVRDYLTKKIIKQKYQIEAEYCPDFVFGYHVSRKVNEGNVAIVQIYPYEYANMPKDCSSKTEYFDEWYNFIKRNVENDNKVVLSYSDKEDKKAVYEFQEYISKMYKETYSIEDVKNAEEMIYLLAKANQVLTGRMHPMIIAILLNKRVVPFTVKEKIDVFKEEWINRTMELSQVGKQISDLRNKIINLYVEEL